MADDDRRDIAGILARGFDRHMEDHGPDSPLCPACAGIAWPPGTPRPDWARTAASDER